MVHIQQFINKPSFKYQPYAPWGHLLKPIFEMKLYGIDNDSFTSNSDSGSKPHSNSKLDCYLNPNSNSRRGSSLTSCPARAVISPLERVMVFTLISVHRTFCVPLLASLVCTKANFPYCTAQQKCSQCARATRGSRCNAIG